MADRAFADVGALWEKRTRAGDKYLSGYLEINGERVPVTIFANKSKWNAADGRPDWIVYVQAPEAPTAAEEHPF